MKQGKIGLKEIGKHFETTFDKSDEWVMEALTRAAPHPDLTGLSAEQWAAESSCSGAIKIDRIEPEYSLEGHFDAKVPVLCPRCGTEGCSERKAEFRVFLKPLERHEKVEDGGDPDYIFLETSYVDLKEILSEQIVAQEGVVDYPDFDRNGKKHQCAALTSGQTESNERNSPFAALKKLKL